MLSCAYVSVLPARPVRSNCRNAGPAASVLACSMTLVPPAADVGFEASVYVSALLRRMIVAGPAGTGVADCGVAVRTGVLVIVGAGEVAVGVAVAGADHVGVAVGVGAPR